MDGGEIGPGHTVTALYAVRLKDGVAGGEADGDRVAKATVRWLDPDTRKSRERTRTVDAATLTEGKIWSEAGTGREGEERRDGKEGREGGEGEEKVSPRFRLTAVAAYFADFLRPREPGGPAENRPLGEPARAPVPPDVSTKAPPRIPGAPSPGTLRAHAARVAKETGDRSAAELSRTIGKAIRLK